MAGNLNILRNTVKTTFRGKTRKEKAELLRNMLKGISNSNYITGLRAAANTPENLKTFMNGAEDLNVFKGNTVPFNLPNIVPLETLSTQLAPPSTPPSFAETANVTATAANTNTTTPPVEELKSRKYKENIKKQDGGRKSRKASRKSRKASRKSRKASRKSRK